MFHANRGELNQLYDTFCRVWAAGGQATLTTTSLEGQVTAKLDIKLGHPTSARPGAPPLHHSAANAFASQHQAPISGAAHRRPCHRGPAAKAKSRARAAAHQAAKAAAAAAPVSSSQQNETESSLASPAPGGAPLVQAPSAPLKARKPLNLLPSPPASDGQRLVVSVGRGGRLPSFSQLDGQDDATLSSPTAAEVEDDIIDVGEAEPDGTPLCEKFKVPPAKVRSTKPAWGIGTFVRINSDSGNFLYEFQNGDWVEV